MHIRVGQMLQHIDCVEEKLIRPLSVHGFVDMLHIRQLPTAPWLSVRQNGTELGVIW